MTVNDLLYHLATLAREGRGGCQVIFDPNSQQTVEHVTVVRKDWVPEDQVRYVQDYTESVVLS